MTPLEDKGGSESNSQAHQNQRDREREKKSHLGTGEQPNSSHILKKPLENQTIILTATCFRLFKGCKKAPRTGYAGTSVFYPTHTQTSFKKIHKVCSPLTYGQPEDCEVGTRCAFISLVAVFYEWCVLSFSESGTLRSLPILVLHAPLAETLSH